MNQTVVFSALLLVVFTTSTQDEPAANKARLRLLLWCPASKHMWNAFPAPTKASKFRRGLTSGVRNVSLVNIIVRPCLGKAVAAGEPPECKPSDHVCFFLAKTTGQRALL
jgi:hypothetical protein